MERKSNRRLFLAIAACGAGAGTAFGRGRGSGGATGVGTDAVPGVYPGFPSQDMAKVLETVAVSHGNFKRVKELVEASPALAKANYDWGYGDWESALGAASHTGNRDIALFLIEKGARPTLFSAVMLGQLSVVQAFVEASPGVQRIPGPHGISLLSHAKAGGERANAVAEYLESVGGAAGPGDAVPLREGEEAVYLGTYWFGANPDDKLEVFDNKGALMIRRGNLVGRRLTHLGNHTFHPAGASSVRIVFSVEGDRASSVTVHDPEPVVTAARRE